MYITPASIAPHLRQMAWNLYRPALELGKQVSKADYKFLLSLEIENNVERANPGLQVAADWIRDPLPEPGEDFSGPLPVHTIQKAKEHLQRYVASELAEYSKDLTAPHNSFFREFAQYRDFVRILFSIYQQSPEFFETIRLYKEEAIALADIFKTLSDDLYRVQESVIVQAGNNRVALIKKPVGIIFYERLSTLFRRLAKDLPPLPQQSNAQKGILTSPLKP